MTGLPKESYDDEAKKEWRRRWRKFIKQLHKPPRETKVVCFPGREALEIFQVYDTLNVPRNNIVGIERDRDSYDHLKAQRLGIELFSGSDTDFFEHTDGKFDVVSLDYDGTFNDQVRGNIISLAGRHLLSNHSALGVTVSGRRENESVQSLYLSGSYNAQLSDTLYAEGEELEKLYKTISDRQKLLHTHQGFRQIAGIIGSTPQDLKGIAITQALRGYCEHGKSLLTLHPISQKTPDLKSFENLLDSIRPVDRNDKLENAQLLEILRYTMLNDMMDFFRHIRLSDHEAVIAHLAKMAARVWEEPYVVSDNERYVYESSGGTPMFSDFLLLRQEQDVLKNIDIFRTMYLVISIKKNSHIWCPVLFPILYRL